MVLSLGKQPYQNIAPYTSQKKTKKSTRKPKELEVRKSHLWDGNLYGLRKIGQGGTAIVFAIDDTTVVKTPVGTAVSLEAFEREREVYRRIQQRPCRHVLVCHETEYPLALILERCVEPVRKRLARMRKGENTKTIGEDEAMDLALRWSYEAAVGLASLHDQGIIQADVGCHNMLLDSDDSLKISDFSGSSISCFEPLATVDYDIHSKLPDQDEPTTQSDLFALGSAMYEMATGYLPYEGLSTTKIVTNFRNKRFPVMNVNAKYSHFADIIYACWNLKFDTAHQVVKRLKDLYQGVVMTRSMANRCVLADSGEHDTTKNTGRRKSEFSTKPHRTHAHKSRHESATLRSQGSNAKPRHKRMSHDRRSSRHVKGESFMSNFFASLKI